MHMILYSQSFNESEKARIFLQHCKGLRLHIKLLACGEEPSIKKTLE